MAPRGVVAAVTISVLSMKCFADCALPTPPGPTPLWGPVSIPNNWKDVCGFLKPPGSHRFWRVNKVEPSGSQVQENRGELPNGSEFMVVSEELRE